VNSKPGLTVQPSKAKALGSVGFRRREPCQTLRGTTSCGRWLVVRSGPMMWVSVWPLGWSWSISTGAPR